MSNIKPLTSAHLAAEFIKSPYAWPGGYPMFAITADSGCLCAACVKAELELIAAVDPSCPDDNQWRIVKLEINFEDADLYCDHCSKRIESAYAEDDAEAPAFEYFINLDERGEFYADVRDATGGTVFEIHGFEIFDDGFMRDKNDLDGLLSHLQSLGICASDATLKKGN